jgi:hypothetical protein
LKRYRLMRFAQKLEPDLREFQRTREESAESHHLMHDLFQHSFTVFKLQQAYGPYDCNKLGISKEESKDLEWLFDVQKIFHFGDREDVSGVVLSMEAIDTRWGTLSDREKREKIQWLLKIIDRLEKRRYSWRERLMKRI